MRWTVPLPTPSSAAIFKMPLLPERQRLANRGFLLAVELEATKGLPDLLLLRAPRLIPMATRCFHMPFELSERSSNLK